MNQRSGTRWCQSLHSWLREIPTSLTSANQRREPLPRPCAFFRARSTLSPWRARHPRNPRADPPRSPLEKPIALSLSLSLSIFLSLSQISRRFGRFERSRFRDAEKRERERERERKPRYYRINEFQDQAVFFLHLSFPRVKAHKLYILYYLFNISHCNNIFYIFIYIILYSYLLFVLHYSILYQLYRVQ